MTPDPITKLYRAPLCHTPVNPFLGGRLQTEDDGALLVRDGRIVASGTYADVRRAAPDSSVVDWRDGFLLPGFVDTHIHFPQLRAIGELGRPLLDWLAHAALPEESRMADPAAAADTAARFVRALVQHGTTTALVFGAHFVGATERLFTAAADAGLRLTSGLVLADRALTPPLHLAPRDGYEGSRTLIRKFHRRERSRYAVTPRFALSTSEALFEVCQSLVREYPDVLVQTHINEQPQEVEACLRAFPWAPDYLAIYERYGLVGRATVLAHNVHATGPELERLAASGASVAHCPCSNLALGSGLFPLARHLSAGVRCALGTDVGGGIGFGILKEALHAALVQRVRPDGVTLGPAHLLYLATLAGADALGLGEDVGDFRPGKSADFVYLRPPAGSPLAAVLERCETLERALSALVTMAGAESVQAVCVAGETIYVQPELIPRPPHP